MQNTSYLSKKLAILLAVLFFIPLTANAQTASDFPNKPIQIIVGWSAGASDDLRARALAPKLGEVLGQPVVVVNKPGAAGTLSLSLVAKSKPDGYTLVSASTSPVIFAPHIQKVEYNPLTDFTYIAGTAAQPWGIVVRSDAPWKTLGELIEYIKNNPGKVKYGSWGIGGGAHVYMEILGKARELNWVHVPFKGDAPSLTALLGGHIPVALTSASFVPHAKAGKLRPLAIIAETRMPVFPETPTLKELGFDFDLRVSGVLGFCGPKGLPPEVLRKLENAFRQAVESDENKQVMERMDSEAKFRTSQEFTQLIQELYPRIGAIIKQLGLSPPEK